MILGLRSNLSAQTGLTFTCESYCFFFRNLFNCPYSVIDYCVFVMEGSSVGNPLRTLLDLPEKERSERGLEHTPREIWQQPDTWRTTYQICSSRRAELIDAIRRAGIGRGSTAS